MKAAEQRARTKAIEAAAVEWIRAKRRIDEVKDAEAQLKRAATLLKTWFLESGFNSVEVADGTIGHSLSYSTVLDQEKVRAELGDRLHDFEKQQQRQTLTLLGKR